MLDFTVKFFFGLILLGGMGTLATLAIFIFVVTIGKIISIVVQKDNWANNFLDHLF